MKIKRKVKPAPQYQSMWGPVTPEEKIPVAATIVKSDQVWADEPGCAVQFTAINNDGAIRIDIIDGKSKIITVTIGRWRWDRVVRTLAGV